MKTPWRIVSIGLMVLGFVLIAGGTTMNSAEAQVTSCAAENLGEAENYTLFACGDVDHNGADSEGRVAVGGNLTATNSSIYTVCGNPPTGDLATGLVIDGDLIATGGGFNVNNDCSAVVGGSIANAGTVNFNGSGTMSSAVGAGNTGIDFASACGAGGTLAAASSQMQGFADSAGMTAIDNGFGTLTIASDGTTNSTNTYYVTVDFSSLASSTINIDMSALPSDATLVINVNPDVTSTTNWGGSTTLTGIAKTNIIWNFDPTITDFTLYSYSWQGSLLAPNATVTLNGGNMEGQTIVDSFVAAGSAETHEYIFGGCILSPSAMTLGDISVGASNAPMMAVGVVMLLLAGSVLLVMKRRETVA